MTQVRKSRHISPRQAAARCRPIDGALKPELFKALCDPTRVGLLACLAKCGRPCTVGEIAECCAVSLSVVSRHLATLEQAGVLESMKKGRTVWYSVRFGTLVGTLRSIADAIESCCPSDGMKCEQGECCHTN